MYFAQGLWTFVMQPIPLLVLAATALTCWPLGVLVARRFRCPRAAAALLVAATGVVVALTLTPNPPEPASYPHFLTLLHHAPGRLRAQVFGPPTDLEQLANIALYVPIGAFGRLVWPSILRATLIGLTLTAGIELCQYDIIGRAGSLTDIRNNTLGALIGAALTAAAIRAGRPERSRR
ncbi:VanZ family protein [Actinoplanes sp. NBRC 103695]|uniref:VanZ family protein n=1 Tax=Actinoplanes sp. NBRC 103695 TaxID=3032202 RepID=UPI002552504E|nr:VanZ family protein [Actinoplanes sp. NBRC 103695]